MDSANKEFSKTSDAIKYKKDCGDFERLNDGTIVGDPRYCQMSDLCRQVCIVNRKEYPMEANYLRKKNSVTGELEDILFCTGMIDKRVYEERSEGDDRVLE